MDIKEGPCLEGVEEEMKRLEQRKDRWREVGSQSLTLSRLGSLDSGGHERILRMRNCSPVVT